MVRERSLVQTDQRAAGQSLGAKRQRGEDHTQPAAPSAESWVSKRNSGTGVVGMSNAAAQAGQPGRGPAQAMRGQAVHGSGRFARQGAATGVSSSA